VEEKQINRQLQLPGLVSLSDHDDIRAGSMLRVLPQFQSAPVSVEWTIPFGPTYFHVGVHNLPPADAPSLMNMLRAFTAAPDPKNLKACFESLHSFRDVLLVLNHPFWDETEIGVAEHGKNLHSLLTLLGNELHALEVNGLRSPAENRRVMHLGRVIQKPVVSGGDRHGCEPNAILNLTSGWTFAEFVDEVRTCRRSHVVFMPQYRESLRWRTMQIVVDALRDYPGSFEGRRTWPERVFYRQPTGDSVPLSAIWAGGNQPKIFSAVTCAVGIVQWPSIRSAIKTMMSLEAWSGVAV
jgi:hypothetical protein